MILERLRFGRGAHRVRPAALRLAAATAVLVMAAPSAFAQITPMSTRDNTHRQERAQRAQDQTDRAQKKAAESQGISLPGGSEIPALQVSAAVDLAEVYTSNASGTTGGGGRSDFFTRPGLNLGLRADTARWAVDADYYLTGEWHMRNHRLDRINNHLNMLAQGEVLPETLFLDARAFATPAVLSRAGSLTADQGSYSSTNTRDTYGFTFRPDLRHTFGGFAQGDLWVAQSGMYFVKPSGSVPTPIPSFFQPAQNTNSTTLTAQLASGTDFTRFTWVGTASATNTFQETAWQKQRSAVANFQYALSRSFALVGTGGYSTYKSSLPLIKDLDGPIGLGGFRYTVDQTFLLMIQGGTQNNFPTYIGSLQWQIGPSMAFLASATDSVSTPQERVLGNLGNMGSTIGGDFYNGSTDFPFGGLGSPAPYGLGGQGVTPLPGDMLSFDNQVSRYRSFQASLSFQVERTSFRLTGYNSIQNRLTQPIPGISPRTTVYGARFDASRQMSREMTALASLEGSRAEEFGGNDRILRASVGLRYRLSMTSSIYTDGTILNRESEGLLGGFQNGSLTDVRVTVGIRKSF